MYGRPVASNDDPTRADRATVRDTYARYEDEGRDQLWDRSNPGFDRLKSDFESRVLGLLARSLGQGSRAIDVGCGNGDLQVLTGGRGLHIEWTGVDLLEERVATARQRAPGATYLVGSGDDLPFEPRSFDVATAITLFSSIPSVAMERAVAAEIGRVLRPGGWLVWYDLRYDNPANRGVHGVSRGRLADLFPGWRIELRTTTLLPPVARRLGRLTPVAYPLLEAVPPLRSHLIGRLRCPS